MNEKFVAHPKYLLHYTREWILYNENRVWLNQRRTLFMILKSWSPKKGRNLDWDLAGKLVKSRWSWNWPVADFSITLLSLRLGDNVKGYHLQASIVKGHPRDVLLSLRNQDSQIPKEPRRLQTMTKSNAKYAESVRSPWFSYWRGALVMPAWRLSFTEHPNLSPQPIWRNY